MMLKEWSFICAGIGMGLEVMTAITYIFVFLRFRQKKLLKRATMDPSVYMEPPPAPETVFDGQRDEKDRPFY